jgi:hypothetical protein
MEFIKSVLAQSNSAEEVADYIEIKEEVDTNE